MEKQLEKQFNRISDRLSQYRESGVCVAFSGGVDSALLLKILVTAGIPVLAVTFHTFLHPCADAEEAKALAEELGSRHLVIEINEMDNPNVLQNPPDRCYHCKHMLFETLLQTAAANGFYTVMDGTNADDLGEYRPGLRALKELGILSPLAEAGLTKTDVRALAAYLGISVASKPSTPCLATRLPYGQQLTGEKLARIEKAEQMLQGLGIRQVRVRSHDNLARIEVEQQQFQLLMEQYQKISSTLRALGFDYVTLDLEGFRSGSMDIHVDRRDDCPGQRN